MYFRGAKLTFANEVIAKSYRAMMQQEADMLHNMMLVFQAQLAPNAYFVVMMFPTLEDCEAFEATFKSTSDQIKEAGTKIEVVRGDIGGFKLAGGVTLDTLVGAAS